MGSQKHGTIIRKTIRNQNGFILPVTMIFMAFFTFYTLNAIERLNDERDFLQKRQLAVQMDLQKKICVSDLISLLRRGIADETKGGINYPEGKLTYSFKLLDAPTVNVTAILYFKNHQDTFQFIYNKDTEEITKWVD